VHEFISERGSPEASRPPNARAAFSSRLRRPIDRLRADRVSPAFHGDAGTAEVKPVKSSIGPIRTYFHRIFSDPYPTSCSRKLVSINPRIPTGRARHSAIAD
jgi:hypothetical protein